MRITTLRVRTVRVYSTQIENKTESEQKKKQIQHVHTLTHTQKTAEGKINSVEFGSGANSIRKHLRMHLPMRAAIQSKITNKISTSIQIICLLNLFVFELTDRTG